MSLSSGAVVGAAVLVPLLAIVVSASPASAEIAAVFPPWWSAARVVEAAASAGEIVSPGAARSVVVVHGDPGVLAARLRRAGAIATLDARAYASCAPSPPGEVS